MSPELVKDAVLSSAHAALCEVAAFEFSMKSVGRFPLTAYLAPHPVEPFIELTLNLVRTFPAFLPFRGAHASIVPHLTVAKGDAEEARIAAAELEDWMQKKAPSTVSALTFLCSKLVRSLEGAASVHASCHQVSFKQG